MATIKFGSIGVSDARGSVGGSTFSRNRGGQYIRQRTKGVNPNSERQASTRATFGTMQSSWRALTEAQRESWRNNATNFPTKNKLGDTITLGGNTLFQKCNMVLAKAGLPPVLTCPNNPAQHTKLTPLPQPAASWLGDEDTSAYVNCTVEFQVSDAALDGDVINFYASAPESAGKKANSGSTRRLLASVPKADWNELIPFKVIVDLTAAYNAAFALGPSVYNSDSHISVNAEIFNESVGFPIPLGNFSITSVYVPV